MARHGDEPGMDFFLTFTTVTALFPSKLHPLLITYITAFYQDANKHQQLSLHILQRLYKPCVVSRVLLPVSPL